jgi:DNA-binding LytR/AlgR family response regulator
MFKIAICDDEEKYLDQEEEILTSIMQNQKVEEYVIHRYHSGDELIENPVETDYQVMFLDITMEGMNGIQTARILREKNPDACIVFVTAYIDYAIEGYQVEAFRFILKDGMETSMPECVKAILNKRKIKEKIMHYSFQEGEVQLPLQSLYYIENYKHQQLFHVKDGQDFEIYHLNSKMDLLEKQLEHLGFLRIQQGYIVNICKVKRMTNYRVILYDCDVEFSIPRTKFSAIKGCYLERLGKMR